MIANERQQRIAAAQIKRFEGAIERATADGPSADVDTRIHDAMIAGMRSQLQELREQLAEYQALREGKIRKRVLHSIAELPDSLIEGRIARRLTQRQLAEQIGVSEQQVQRYEQTRYSGASIERLQAVAEALELTITKTVEYRIPSVQGRASAKRRAGPAKRKKIRSKAASAAGKTLRAKGASNAAKKAAASDLSRSGRKGNR